MIVPMGKIRATSEKYTGSLVCECISFMTAGWGRGGGGGGGNGVRKRLLCVYFLCQSCKWSHNPKVNRRYFLRVVTENAVEPFDVDVSGGGGAHCC